MVGDTKNALESEYGNIMEELIKSLATKEWRNRESVSLRVSRAENSEEKRRAVVSEPSGPGGAVH